MPETHVILKTALVFKVTHARYVDNNLIPVHCSFRFAEFLLSTSYLDFLDSCFLIESAIVFGYNT